MPYASPTDQYRGYRHPFLFGVHYAGGVGDTPRTLIDLAMSQFSADIRRTPDWWQNLQKEKSRKLWTDLGHQPWAVRTPSLISHVNLSQKQISYVLEELQGYAALRDEKYRCQVSCFERVWESDSILDSVTSTKLKEALDNFKHEDPRVTFNDDSVTIDVIDPMLHCLVHHRTLVTQTDGRSPRTIPHPPSTDIYTVSPHFALLPSDVLVSHDGSSVKFLSYINNVHPDDHRNLYELFEQLLGGVVPLFEHTLTDLHRNNPLTPRIPGRCRYSVWDEPDPPEHSDDEEGWSAYERDMREWTLSRPIDLPDVPSGYPGGIERRKHNVYLKNKTLQVIISASEIRLGSQDHTFPGSPWHVEGMRNERIVACGFHCLSAENITESFIEFRMAVTYPRGFSAGDTGATLRTWGIRDGDSCHQYIGTVPIRTGLSLVFPNIYQHRQTTFTLTDPSKEGHLTAVWFYLVDPEIKPIVSTAVVAPQQKAWIHKALDNCLDSRLPNEVVDKILDHVEGLMTFQEAVEYKKQLLATRKDFTRASNSYHFCIPFDIWIAPELSH
ncbi:hypothetical protein B0H34DRAFT_682074 [Crassisporium funariophilum]|nr:hypothetical protein B0H34DRAFT_682074 [Crassisporium funariophilum]